MKVDPSLLAEPTGDDILVLHVDDDPGQRDLAKTYLERAAGDLTVRTRASASAGLECLRSASVDCVVSDYRMPEMDGLAFLEAVRADFPDLPFVLFTGQGSEEIASKAISAGVTEYLQKETGTEQYSVLANRIRNLVRGARNRRALAQAEDLFGRVFEARTEALVLLEAEDREVLAANERVEAVLGHDPESLVADDRRPILSNAGAECAGVLADIDPGERTEFECSGGADGERTVEAVASRLSLHGLETILVSLRDITERLEREQERRALRTAVEHAGHSIYVTDRDGTITDVNPAFEEMTGYDRESAIGATPAILKSGVHDDEFYAELWETIESGEVWRNHVVNERADGERYVVDQTIAPVQQGDAIEGFVAVNAEVPASRREPTPEATSGAEAKEVVESIPVPALIAEAESGVLVAANQAAAELFECAREELVSCHQSDLHPDTGSYRRLFREQEQAIRATGPRCVTRVQTPDGEPVQIETATGDRRQVAITATPMSRTPSDWVLGIFIDLSSTHPEAAPA